MLNVWGMILVLRLGPSRLCRERCVNVPYALPCRTSVPDTDWHRPYSRQSTEAPSFGLGRVETDIKKSLEPVLKAYEKAQASKYATEVSSGLVLGHDHSCLATSTHNWCKLS